MGNTEILNDSVEARDKFTKVTKVYKCNKCGKSFNNVKYVNRHLKVVNCNNDKDFKFETFKCNICGKYETNRKDSLVRHAKTCQQSLQKKEAKELRILKKKERLEEESKRKASGPDPLLSNSCSYQTKRL